MRTLATIVKIQFFTNLEINQSLAKLWSPFFFFQENQLKLGKNSELMTCLLVLLPSLCLYSGL